LGEVVNIVMENGSTDLMQLIENNIEGYNNKSKLMITANQH
jgi:hypothetical protein